MKIGQKLTIGFLGIALLIGVIGYMAINSLRRITADVRQISETSIDEVEGATEMTAALLKIELSAREYFLEKIENRLDEVARAKKDLEEGFKNFEKAIELEKKATEVGIKLAAAEEEEEERKELEKVKLLEEKYALYKKSLIKTIAICEEKGYDVADKFYEDEVEESAITLLAHVRTFEEDAEEEIISEANEVYTEARAVTRLIVIITGVCLFLAIILGLLIARTITRPITKLKDAATEIGKGKLDTKVVIKSKDEIGMLVSAFSEMTENLKSSQEKIQAQNEELNASNEELKSANEEIAATNEELASTNEELKQTNEELESTTEGLRAANDEAQAAKEAAEKKAAELERFNKVAVGRELKMRELKERIAELEEKLKERNA